MEKQIRLGDKVFELYLRENIILNRIKDLADHLNNSFTGKNPLFIAVLNGSFMFASDLMKWINFDCGISFIRYASYNRTKSTGQINRLLGLSDELTGRNVFVLEDIIDSGHTMLQVIEDIKSGNPATICIATLLYKENPVFPKHLIDFTGFEIPPDFVVGYGLDYMGMGRNLRDIYRLVL